MRVEREGYQLRRLRVPSARGGAMGDDSRNRVLAFDRFAFASRVSGRCIGHRVHAELTVVRESRFWCVTTAVAPPLEVLVSAQINVFGSMRRAWWPRYLTDARP